MSALQRPARGGRSLAQAVPSAQEPLPRGFPTPTLASQWHHANDTPVSLKKEPCMESETHEYTDNNCRGGFPGRATLWAWLEPLSFLHLCPAHAQRRADTK